MDILENLFKLKENNTSIKTEFFAAVTTFFTMSYIFILCPKILSLTGLDFNSTITATSIIIFISCTIMGLISNKPYAVAPFLGEIAFVAYTIVATLGFSVKTVLAAIFVSGLILLLMSFFNLREYILNKIPDTIKLSFCSGLGLFFIFIALKDMKIVQFTQNSIPLSFGNFKDIHLLLGLFCFILMVILIKRKIRCAILISIMLTTIIGIIIGDVALPSQIVSAPHGITSSVMQLDFAGLLDRKFIPILFVIFLLINIDTSGVLIGIAYKTEKNIDRVNLKRSMIGDSIAVILSPLLGTTTSGVFLDSMTGITDGGRTGLTAVFVGLFFLVGLIFTPIITIIPPYAYAPALLYVGILVSSVITNVNFDDITEYSTAYLTVAAMVLTYNIGSGILLGFIYYPLVKFLCGQKKQTNPVHWILFVSSIIYFIIYPN